ncbi:MAG: tRNA (N(6)-L-threonylcarbamoyladenosine(37)-C(2))-methylthiotransferase MtaB [Dehalococcoidales bacterium]|nr:tRNA (N(6)-L-threonylcarbamoyladenosine(37)-C(2))-methylthiotransferase MtaB [Dehalococcoidales bacterium]
MITKNNKAVRVALETLGCKLNQAETESLARQLLAAGYTLVSPAEEADVYVLNSCTVTHVADRKSRHLLRLAHRHNPEALLVATGCYAERAPQELAGIGGVDLVVGNGEKAELLALLANSRRVDYPHDSLNGLGNGFHPIRTRAFIKIQDGCSNFCTFCIVPLVRGRERSVAVDRIVAEISARVSDGCKEVVLTGTEIGSYRCDGVNLKGLLERILTETDVTRLRLTSLQPQEISPELITLWRDRRLCRHFHLSLQSGSESVIRRMGRRYGTSDYRQAVSLIREQIPGVAITTDVIVGFPGETEAEFEDSFSLCRDVGFARMHVFSYSSRPGTKAARMPHQVGEQIKRSRSQKMLALARESGRMFRRQFLGKTIPVLWEQSSNGLWSGHTDNYIKAYTRSREDFTNQLLPVELVKVWQDGVWGQTD